VTILTLFNLSIVALYNGHPALVTQFSGCCGEAASMRIHFLKFKAGYYGKWASGRLKENMAAEDSLPFVVH